jgi:hypothetical protein
VSSFCAVGGCGWTSIARRISRPLRFDMLNSLAALPAVAAIGMPRTVAGPDPIFAAIEAVKRTEHESYKSYEDYADGPDAWREEYPGVEEAYDTACDELAETIPTTLAGCVAVVTLWLADDPDMACRIIVPMMQNLLTALQRLSAA